MSSDKWHIENEHHSMLSQLELRELGRSPYGHQSCLHAFICLYSFFFSVYLKLVATDTLRDQRFSLLSFIQLLVILSQYTCIILVFHVWSLSVALSTSKVWTKAILLSQKLNYLWVTKHSIVNFSNLNHFFLKKNPNLAMTLGVLQFLSVLQSVWTTKPF